MRSRLSRVVSTPFLLLLVSGVGCSRPADLESRVEEALAGLPLRERVAQLIVAEAGEATSGFGAVRFSSRIAAGTGEAPPIAPLVVGEIEQVAGEIPPLARVRSDGDAELATEVARHLGRAARRQGIHVGLVTIPLEERGAPLRLPRPSGEAPWSVVLRALGEAGIAPGARVLAGAPQGLRPWDRARIQAVEMPALADAAGALEALLLAPLALPSLGGDTARLPLSPVANHAMRRDLGFEGIVIADLRALDGGKEAELAERALAAGADLLLGLRDPPATLALLVEAVEAGRLPRDRIDEAARRVLTLKARLDLLGGGESRGAETEAVEDSGAAALTARAAERTLLRLGADARRVLRRCVAPALLDAADAGLLRGEAARLHPAVQRIVVPSAAPPQRLAESLSGRGCVLVAERSAGAPLLERIDSIRAADSLRVELVWIGLLDTLPAPPPRAASVLMAAGAGPAAQAAVARALFDPDGPSPALPRGSSWPAAPTLRVVPPGAVGMSASGLAAVDRVIRAAIADGLTPGAAVAIGRRGGLVRLRGYGTTDGARPVHARNTVWDVASLTKVVGTTAAVMTLVDDGRLTLDTPVREHLPEFRGEGKEDVTIRHLLLHTSGLPAGAWLYGSAPSPERAFVQAARARLVRPPGRATVYSDFGYILLAEVVRRVAEAPMDELLARRIFAPLGMGSTFYLPPRWIHPRIAPTAEDSEREFVLRGVVHDGNAFRLGGVAGHAGLFSTAPDLAVFAQMLLNGGAYGSRRVLSEAVVERFTRRAGPRGERTLGWDRPDRRSSAGSYFSTGSFGHTGYTGTSIWIDPSLDLFVVLLTNRTFSGGTPQGMLQLRERVANAAARAITDQPVPRRPRSVAPR